MIVEDEEIEREAMALWWHTRFGFPDQDSADVAYVQAILELSFG